jgi:hypothetical protein
MQTDQFSGLLVSADAIERKLMVPSTNPTDGFEPWGKTHKVLAAFNCRSFAGRSILVTPRNKKPSMFSHTGFLVLATSY